MPEIWQAGTVRLGVPLRSVGFRLADGRLAVYSPILGLGEDAHRTLKALGEPALLVAPNHYHHLGLAEYATAYPQSGIVGSSRAVRRLQTRCRHPVEDEERLRQALPSNVSVLVPPGTRTGEMWLSVAGAAGRAWIVGDAFFNIARTPRSLIGLVLKVLRICPGLRIGDSFRWLVKDRRSYRAWLLETLAAERPTILIPCHGDIVVDDALPDRLESLTRASF